MSETVAIRFSRQEKRLIERAALLSGTAFSDFVRAGALERAEDDIDRREYLQAMDDGSGEQLSMEEVSRMARGAG